ncbi:MAG: membrane protein insertase YidC [Acidobacteriota bacterium]|nr:membrane protein insertase YidC [Acidobacteriota bacterium]
MQKRTLLAFGLMLLFFYLWAWFGQKMGYVPDKPAEPETLELVEKDPEESAPDPDPAVTSEPVPAETEAEPEEPVEEIAREEIVLENNHLKVVLDNKGGVVAYAVLNDYYVTSKEERLLELAVPTRHFPGEILLKDGISTRDKMFKVVERGENRVVFAHTGKNLEIRKEFTLGESYTLAYKADLVRAPDSEFSMVIAEGLQRIGPKDKLTPSMLDLGAINPKIMYFTWSEEGDSEQENVGKNLDRNTFVPVEAELPMEWLGVKDNFFANVFLPDEPVTRAGMKVTDQFFVSTRKSVNLPVMALHSSESVSGRFYMGPMKETLLLEADPKLENLISYGWAGLLSKWLFIGLDYSHNLTGNWGWAIVILTLFIRLLMMPLMVPSVKSSFKMRKLQPKMKKLQEKYSGNDMETKQKLQKETFALYKKEGVNPFSSCITMLLQMPVFFAYFSLLRSSIYLRQAEWEFWIHDLSIKDTTYVLPIIMGATMWLSTMAMPMTGGDPAQQKMMKIMPVLFSLMFIGMPSGLILYMITSNIFTLIQTKVLNWRFAKE